jgi:3'(2'), 5'-bisphosphate nucleotidase
MSEFFDKNQIDKILSFALEAGEISAKSFKEKNFTIKRKADGSSVSSTDLLISNFLNEKLTKEFPQIPIICEEGNLRDINEEIFFLIDPIDGTSSFIKNSPEFCINIALVKNNKAIFGLIYAPLFEGGKLAFRDQENRLIVNDKIIKRAKFNYPKKLKIITSSRSKDFDISEYVTKNFPDFAENFVVEKLASAIKFFRIIENEANLYLHFRPSMEWDTASGQALAEINGGTLKHLNSGEILTYKKPGFENSPFLLRSF